MGRHPSAARGPGSHPRSTVHGIRNLLSGPALSGPRAVRREVPMSDRTLTPRSSLDALKREARRWLRALEADDPAVRGPARERLARALPDPPAAPGLRDVQLALAREH